ncbi:MAG: parvulin peptidyl-prolyl isomerase [Planctomycetota bacterium]
MRFPLNRQARAGIYTTLTIAALATSGRDAQAQTARSNPKPISTQAAAKNQADAQQQVDPNAPKLKSTRIPSSPNDPVAIVNNQVITRQQLAEEAIARKGEEILDTLIARVMIDQALKSKGIAVTADEVNAEIEAMAQRMAGLSRDAWLRTLAKERNISPIQYARDIIYPSLALKKLAESRVQVTDTEITEAYEAMYGEKLRVRVIMVDKMRAAQEAWEKLRLNPASFEKLAMQISMDPSRSIGGLQSDPIARFSNPRTVSDSAFRQLVDGDTNDKDAKHKPKDGDFTGPIQITESAWVIIKREGVIPRKEVDKNDPKVTENLRQLVFDAKIKEKISEVFSELEKQTSIENRLSGRVKVANEEAQPEAQDLPKKQTLAEQTPARQAGVADPAVRPTTAAATAAARKLNIPAPKSVDPSEINRINQLRQSAGSAAAPR